MTGKKTEILVGRGAVGELGKAVAPVAPAGSLAAIVYDFRYVKAAADVDSALRRGGLITQRIAVERCYPSIYEADKIHLPEGTRIAVSVGGGTAADLARYAAMLYKVPAAVVAASPSTCSYLAPAAALIRRGFTDLFAAPPPEALILDTGLMSNSSEEAINGFCSLVTRATAATDCIVASRIAGQGDTSAAGKIISAVTGYMAEAEKAAGNLSLLTSITARYCAVLSAALQADGSTRLYCGSDTSAYYALRMLFGREERTLPGEGESELILSASLIKLFERAVMPASSFSPPADNNMRAERMAEYLGVSEAAAAVRLSPYLDPKEYRVRDYKLRLFRSEIKKAVSDLRRIILKGLKIYGSLCPDSGYHVREYFAADDLTLAAAFAPELTCKYTMLSLLKDRGMSDRYIA